MIESKEVTISICVTKRGRYSLPQKINSTSLRKIVCCNANAFGHPRKIWWQEKDMYVQKWHLSDEELESAIKDGDIFSLDMPDRIICPFCAKLILKEKP